MRLLWMINGTAHDQLQMQFLNYLSRFSGCPQGAPGPTAVCMLFIFPVDMNGRVVARFRELGAEVVSLEATGPISLRSLAAAARVMAAFKPDIIHSQHAIAGVHARLAGLWYRLRYRALPSRCRIIGEQRNAKRGLSRSARLLETMTFPVADLILCSSPGVEASWFGGSPQQIDPVVYTPQGRKHFTFFNSIDVKRFRLQTASLDRETERVRLGLKPDQIVVATVASLSRQKNYPMLLQAFAALRDRMGADGTGLVLLCVGEGDRESEIASIVDSLGLGRQVSLLGYRTDIDRILHACDIFVLCSRWEGLAKALLEAMSVAKPCIATDVEGNVDVITHEYDGLLVPSDDAGALADALLRLIRDPDLAAELGRRAADSVARFSVEAQACRLLQIYRRLLGHDT